MLHHLQNLNIRGGTRRRGGGGDRGGHRGRGGFHRGGPPAARPIEEHPTVQVNAVRLRLQPNWSVYKYDVRIALANEDVNFRREITNDRFEANRKKCVALLSHAMEEWNVKGYVYNRASCLYSIDKDLANSITFHGTEVPESDVGDCNVTVTLVSVSGFPSSTNDLKACLNINPGQHQPDLLEYLNMVIEKQAFDKSNLWFSDNGIHCLQSNEGGNLLENGMMAKPGMKTSVKVYGEDIDSLFVALVVDIKVRVFHVAQPLIEKYNEMKQNRLDMHAVNHILKGLNVVTTYGDRKRIVKINNLTGTAKSTYFEIDGNRITVTDFYANYKNITLKHPDLPLVCHRKGTTDSCNYFPIELLDVVPNQTVRIEKMDDRVQEAVIQFSAMAPQVRLDMCRRYMQLLGLTSTNAQLANFGVRILDDKFIQVTANTLHAVRLDHNVAPTNNVNIPVDRFTIMPKITNWAIVNLGARPDTFERFVEFMNARMDAKGIERDHPTVFRFNGCPKDLLLEAQNDGIRYLMVIMDDRNKGHDELKYYEIKTQIITQIVKASNAHRIVSKGQRVTMDNILMKLSIKNGGVPYSVESGSSDLKIITDDIMYIGLEFSHQQPMSGMDVSLSQNLKLPSRVGYGATCGNDPRKVLGDYTFLKPHEPVDIYSKIEDICSSCIEAFKMNRKALPKTVVIYVTGFSEGKWYEMEKQFKERAKKGCGCNIILIAVSTNHMERFYKTRVEGRNPSEQNVSAGLAISDTLVSPVAQEFFLHPHVVLKGTARTPKYTVLLNEPNVELLSIMQATHALCFLHEICTTPVSVPAVLTVADRCALRGQSVMRYFMRVNRISELTVEDANLELNNPTDGFHLKIRYNA